MAMHTPSFYAVLALFQGPSPSTAAAFAAAAGRAADAMTSRDDLTRGTSREIPEWKLEQVLNSSGVLATPATAVPGTQAEGLPWAPTAGQSFGRCPIVKLPSLLALRPTSGTWQGLTGEWAMTTGAQISLASFGQSYFSPNWDTVYIRNLDQRLALKGQVTSNEQLLDKYSWKSQAGPMDYPSIVNLQKKFAKAALWTAMVDGHRDYVQRYMGDPKETPTVMSLIDCEGALMFVVRFYWPKEATQYPGGIDVYDKVGNLLGHALGDPLVARYQFVDTHGYLLATAESPGINQNVSMRDMPRDQSKGNVLPFELQFEGGYQNASQLLGPDWRWVLASAVQLRAIQNANSMGTPALPGVLVAFYWICAGLGILAVCFTCSEIYRLVFPRTRSTEPLSAKSPGSPYYTMSKNV